MQSFPSWKLRKENCLMFWKIKQRIKKKKNLSFSWFTFFLHLQKNPRIADFAFLHPGTSRGQIDQFKGDLEGLCTSQNGKPSLKCCPQKAQRGENSGRLHVPASLVIYSTNSALCSPHQRPRRSQLCPWMSPKDYLEIPHAWRLLPGSDSSC